jgi:hypothetical protein
MDDSEILQQITAMIEAEHELRRQHEEAGVPGPDEETTNRLQALEESLDQCWDLLRQRRAHREFGEDPETSTARPVSQVENYLQ